MSQITAITVPRLEEPADSKANSHTTASLRTASQVTDEGKRTTMGAKAGRRGKRSAFPTQRLTQTLRCTKTSAGGKS